jgi:hypothetical protein
VGDKYDPKEEGEEDMTTVNNQTPNLDAMARAQEAKKKAEELAAAAHLAAQEAMAAAEAAGVKVGDVQPSRPVTQVTAAGTGKGRKPCFSVREPRDPANRGFCLIQLPSPIPGDPNKVLLGTYKSICQAAAKKTGGKYEGAPLYGWKVGATEVDHVVAELLTAGFIEVKAQRQAENDEEERCRGLLLDALPILEEGDVGLGTALCEKLRAGFALTDGQWRAVVALGRKYSDRLSHRTGISNRGSVGASVVAALVTLGSCLGILA